VADDTLGVVADLWRYPVKSFGGERVRRTFLGPFGLLGDRRYAVSHAERADGPLSARRASALLGFRARYLDGDTAEAVSVETPGGLSLGVDDHELWAEVGRATGHPVSIDQSAAGFHDAAALHLVTQASVAALGEWLDDEVDPRRFRANLVVETEAGDAFTEAGWPGLRLVIGDAEIEVIVSTERCAVTTFDPDTLERNTEVLATLARERDNFFGVYARVRKPGWIEVGADIRVAPLAPE
jgi:uncharacterized protein